MPDRTPIVASGTLRSAGAPTGRKSAAPPSVPSPTVSGRNHLILIGISSKRTTYLVVRRPHKTLSVSPFFILHPRGGAAATGVVGCPSGDGAGGNRTDDQTDTRDSTTTSGTDSENYSTPRDSASGRIRGTRPGRCRRVAGPSTRPPNSYTHTRTKNPYASRTQG